MVPMFGYKLNPLPSASPADPHSQVSDCRRGGLTEASQIIFFPITKAQYAFMDALRVRNISHWLLDKNESQELSQGLVSLTTATRWIERFRHSTRSLAPCCQTHISDQSPAENVVAIEANRWSNKLPLVYQ